MSRRRATGLCQCILRCVKIANSHRSAPHAPHSPIVFLRYSTSFSSPTVFDSLNSRSYTKDQIPDSDELDESEDTNHEEEELNLDEIRPQPVIKLNPLQKGLLAFGTGLASFLDPTRAESIAVFGEVTADIVLQNIYDKMKADPEGARILDLKPRINTKEIDIPGLSTLPEGTLGHTYLNFLRINNVTPDSRLPVRFIEDPELAYVLQRYRECHDLVHAVTGQPTNMLGEVVVKWIEGIQTGLPMCVLGGLFGATRLKPKHRAKYLETHLPWAIQVGLHSRPFLHIFYEERWEQSIYELRHYISPLLNKPPPLK